MSSAHLHNKSTSPLLVTGATGFIGSNICRRLVARGEAVHVFLRRGTCTWRIDDLQDKLNIHWVDLREPKQVEQAIQQIRPNIIYHLATHGAYHYQDSPERILLTNMFGTWNLLNACRQVGFDLFVNTGSSSEYGRKQYAMRETDVVEPNSYYAVAKCGQTLLCQHIARADHLDIVTIRPFSVYGPYEEPTRLVPQLMRSALKGDPIRMVSANTCRDFIYIDDVVDVYLAVEKLKACAGEILNIGTGVQTTLRQLISTMEEVAGRTINARWEEMEPRTWDADVWVADVSKIRRLTGLHSKFTLEQGLLQCLQWFRTHLDMKPTTEKT